MQLDGKKIAILIAPRGTEDPEFAKPKTGRRASRRDRHRHQP